MDAPQTSSSDTTPSLSNPPNAPKKVQAQKQRNLDGIRPLRLNEITEEEEEEQVEEGGRLGRQAEFWTLLATTGHIRTKFLQYVPEDIPDITDHETLLWLRSCYFPASQPHTLIEDAYCRLMYELIEKQIAR